MFKHYELPLQRSLYLLCKVRHAKSRINAELKGTKVVVTSCCNGTKVLSGLYISSGLLNILHVETTISSFNSFPDTRSVVHLICKDRKVLLSRCNRKSPLLYIKTTSGGSIEFTPVSIQLNSSLILPALNHPFYTYSFLYQSSSHFPPFHFPPFLCYSIHISLIYCRRRW